MMDTTYFIEQLDCHQGSCETQCGSKVVNYSKNLNVVRADVPIVVLLHGYPQSWRHVISLLPRITPIFIPDIPGYGQSTPSKKGHDKRTIGHAILEALRDRLNDESRVSLILIGHDRGARICHRLATDGLSMPFNFDLLGTVLLDIQPTLTQFKSFGSAANAVKSFHWSFLANVDYATEMILAQGGPIFCRSLIRRWAGSDVACLKSLESNEALSVYGDYFEQESVIRATCEDYRAAAEEDLREQEADQENNKKMGGEVLVIYSKEFLGRFDVRRMWSAWVSEVQALQVEEVDRSGHFVAEERPDVIAKLLIEFVQRVSA